MAHIGVAGATGLVGKTLLEILELEKWDGHIVSFFATEKEGEQRFLEFRGEKHPVLNIEEVPENIDYILSAIPNNAAEILVPKWNKAGIKVIDKSSVYRMADNVPLVVPEVNDSNITNDVNLIATPNCSTTQLAVVLKPLHDLYGMEEVRVSTYQSISGAGVRAVELWQDQMDETDIEDDDPTKWLEGNVIPQIGSLDESGNYSEERKLHLELVKIFGLDGLKVAATAVRVPVYAGHSEAVEVKFKKEVNLDEVNEVLENFPGITLEKDHTKSPTPLIAAGMDDVFVGRVREHPWDRQSLLFWCVSDNLRKGAATNALQILEKWIKVNSL